MMNPQHEEAPAYIPRVDLADFNYDLPADRIAEHPLAERDAGRMLCCDAATGTIEHRRFRDLPRLLPSDALLVMNTTRVVHARVVMHRGTGGRVELFVLEPAGPERDPGRALAQTGAAEWTCMVGGARKLEREGELHGAFTRPGGERLELGAALVGRDADGFRIRFRWTPEHLTFAEMLEAAGRVPLPPYIKRDATPGDDAAYQTVYARHEGAVAAPTAGLHFTPAVLAELAERGVRTAELTLHVGAGTFKQVSGDVARHAMHEERIVVGVDALRTLAEHAQARAAAPGTSPFVVVGTTSLRTLESLYWFGARLLLGEAAGATELEVGQWDPYRLAGAALPEPAQALETVLGWCERGGRDAVAGSTGIIIVPGYSVRLCDVLITNFHQPNSTLLLLVGAILGRDLLQRVYGTALEEGYRFLSYGDSSMLSVKREAFSVMRSA